MENSLKTSAVAVAFALSVVATASFASGHDGAVFSEITPVETPVGPGAQDPSLFATETGEILMSWTEPSPEGHAVRLARWDGTRWSDPQTVIASDQLFVNWADIPSVAEFADGTLAAHWLQDNGRTSYAYDVNLALSDDGGETWGEPITPHRDGRSVQHGFATLLPLADGQLMAIWLDGRQFGLDDLDDEQGGNPNEMQLRAALMQSDGALGEEMLIDARTCTCCQTSAAVAGDGSVILIYRDRTADDVRDISVVRYLDGAWTAPSTIRDDGWQISGCPVNGPEIDARGTDAVAAWFTAPDDIPAVYVAFSDDAGASFADAHRVDLGEPAGRVDVVLLEDGTAIVSWVEWTENGEAIMVCRADAVQGCRATQRLYLNTARGTINFPHMVSGATGMDFAWTQPGMPDEHGITGHDTIRMVRAGH